MRTHVRVYVMSACCRFVCAQLEQIEACAMHCAVRCAWRDVVCNGECRVPIERMLRWAEPAEHLRAAGSELAILAALVVLDAFGGF